jgi:hypothetical protein
MRRAKLLRTRAQKWPKAKAMRAHKFAGVHQARARHLAANPEPLVEPALPENKQQNALQQDNNTSSLAQNALGQEDHVIFLEALQPTNIRPVECDDPNLPHVPSLAKTGDLSVHGWWQKQRLIDLPGAECLAHAAGENLTRASLASKIRYYSDRLLGHLFTANCNLRDALDPS